MIAAEDDHGPLQRAHTDGSGSPVPNHEDIYTSTGTTVTRCGKLSQCSELRMADEMGNSEGWEYF